MIIITHHVQSIESKVNHLDEDEADELENLELSEDYLLQDVCRLFNLILLLILILLSFVRWRMRCTL